MEYYHFLLIVLFSLGLFNLVVGVGNDAVNFTNSAIGSRVSNRNMIMVLASIGIVFGVLSSTGMMEVARKGIFRPSGFTLEELMLLFTSVMIADILLLDFYNTVGLPTSTTVSLVFGLFGSALVLAIWKTGSYAAGIELINVNGAIRIVSGIVLSVVIAFASGLLVQFVVRLVFTFRYKQTVKRYGGLLGGVSFTVLAFFIFSKAMKNSPWIDRTAREWVNEHLLLLLLVSFAVWTVVFYALIAMRRNIYKPIILVGTGALAMAFAGNDLVNFIGVPIAGFASYQAIVQNGGDALRLGTALTGKVATPISILGIAATVMIITLWFSRKARTVTKTELSLSSQGDVIELFSGRNPIARIFVQMMTYTFGGLFRIVPPPVRRWIDGRFETHKPKKGRMKDMHSFDELRAVTNITLASILIIYATSLKLPLSTTYVTFMVAMGSSLADRAWNRTNAVDRVAGVLTVIGGWFMTAVIAVLTAGATVTLIYHFRIIAVVGLLIFCVYLLWVFRRIYALREEEYEKQLAWETSFEAHPDTAIKVLWKNFDKSLLELSDVVGKTLRFHEHEKGGGKKKIKKKLQTLENEHATMITRLVQFGNMHIVDTEEHYMPVLTKIHADIARMIQSGFRLNKAVRQYSESFPDGFDGDEAEEYRALYERMRKLLRLVGGGVEMHSKSMESVPAELKQIHRLREQIGKNQLKRMKKGKSLPRRTVSFLQIVDEISEFADDFARYLDSLKKIRPLIKKGGRKVAEGKTRV